MSAPTGDRLHDVVTTPEREGSYRSNGQWDDARLVDRIAEHAVTNPDAPAVFDDEHSAVPVTCAELEDDANWVASLLRERGIQPGDVVALQLPNWYASVAIAVGIMKIGAVVNPMLPSYRDRELRHMLAVGSTTALFTPATYRDFDHRVQIDGLRTMLPDLQHHLVVSPILDELADLPARAVPPVVPDRPASAVAELMFTSGTEAEPKAIMHTEQTLNANIRATWTALGMSPSDSVWMPAPIGHSTGFNHGLRMALFHRIPLILQDRWDPVVAAQMVDRHRPTHTLLSTTFLRDLTDAAHRGAGDVSSLTRFGCGGAAVPGEVVTAAGEVGICCLRLYGATEFLVATWNRPDSSESHRTESDGSALPGVEVEVRGPDGSSVVDTVGEIYVRSPSGSVGFYRDEARTRETYVDGWIRSGDLGTIDAHGHLAVTGRRKEIVIRGGLNIAPREIETLLQQIPGVRLAAVIGLPHQRLGETTCACVELLAGHQLTFADMTEHLRASGLARFKWPERLEIVPHMPTTATGKVRKYELVARLQSA